jgi:hypothetical protein
MSSAAMSRFPRSDGMTSGPRGVGAVVVRVLLVCGSLQRRSANRAALDVVRASAIEHGATVEEFDALADIPAFDFTRQDEPIAAVTDLPRSSPRPMPSSWRRPSTPAASLESRRTRIDWLVGSGDSYCSLGCRHRWRSPGGHPRPLGCSCRRDVAGRIRARRVSILGVPTTRSVESSEDRSSFDHETPRRNRCGLLRPLRGTGARRAGSLDVAARRRRRVALASKSLTSPPGPGVDSVLRRVPTREALR